MNITEILNKEFTPSKECFDWCKEAHFNHYSNLNINNAIALLGIAAGAVIFKYLIIYGADPKTEKEQNMILGLIEGFDYAAVFLIIAYLWITFL